MIDFRGAASVFFGNGTRGGSPMKPHPVPVGLLGPVLRLVLPPAAGERRFPNPLSPPRGRRRITPVPSQIQARGARKVPGAFFTGAPARQDELYLPVNLSIPLDDLTAELDVDTPVARVRDPLRKLRLSLSRRRAPG